MRKKPNPNAQADARLAKRFMTVKITGQASTNMVLRIGPSRMRSRNRLSFPLGGPV